MEPIHSYDEVHVISDLHLGGVRDDEQNFQVFRLGRELGAYIDRLTASDVDGRQALVINGDAVDFIAEPDATYFDPQGAPKKLHRILRDPSFAPVTEALERFVGKPRRRLVVNLGNHDLELALPWVREALLDELASDDAAARGRVITTFDGAGYLCEVDGRRVLCVHGNEVDPWNVTDHERIRRIGRDLVQGRGDEPWEPNAGTKMVIEVMNGIKAQHPFIDLLKPEAEGAVPVLLALDKSQARKLAGVLPVAARLGRDSVLIRAGFLSAEDDEEAVDADASPEAALDELVARRMGGSSAPAAPPSDDVDDLLARAEERTRSGADALDVAIAEEGLRGDEQLGVGGALWKAILRRPKAEVVREALEGLMKDQSFELTHEDALFRRLDETIGADVDVLISGHSHLERALRRQHGGGVYFNTGTWIRLIRLTPEVLGDDAAFGEVFDVFSQGTMAALDGADGLVLDKPAAAAVYRHDGGVRAELRRPGVGDGADKPPQVVRGSAFDL